MQWFLDLCKGKMLTDRDLLMLTQFLGVLNYFSAVYLLMWLRRHYSNAKHFHPIVETVVHVYLYLVYLLEIFSPNLRTEFVICIYVFFSIVVFSYHVSICRRFQYGYSATKLHDKTTAKSHWKHSVKIVALLWLLWTIVCLSLAFNARNFLGSPKYFNLVLKVSFISLAVEGYLYVAHRQPQEHSSSPRFCASPMHLMRTIYSGVTFVGMLVLAFYPDIVGRLSITKILSQHVVEMVAMIAMQLLFVLDSLVYVAHWYTKNYGKKGFQDVRRNSMEQMYAL